MLYAIAMYFYSVVESSITSTIPAMFAEDYLWSHMYTVGLKDTLITLIVIARNQFILINLYILRMRSRMLGSNPRT